MSSKTIGWGPHPPQVFTDAFLSYLDGGRQAERLCFGWDRDIISLKNLFGVLWNCIDVLPDKYCSLSGLGPGCSYAQAIQKFARERHLETF